MEVGHSLVCFGDYKQLGPREVQVETERWIMQSFEATVRSLDVTYRQQIVDFLKIVYKFSGHLFTFWKSYYMHMIQNSKGKNVYN